MRRVRSAKTDLYWQIFVTLFATSAVFLGLGALLTSWAAGQTWQVLVGIAAALLLAAAPAWWLARRIAAPLQAMIAVTEDLRRGRYQSKAYVTAGGTLGNLAGSLNKLGTELAGRFSELERLENVRRDFVANVSHEIKTPLTSIRGYVETLLGGAVNDPEHNMRFLSKIDRNAGRLSMLVTDLLSLARIEAAEASLVTQATSWDPIIRAVVSSYEDTFSDKNLKVTVTTPPQPVRVLGDKEAMVQVLDNLLTNAIKYTPHGGQITVTLTREPRFGVLRVRDSGIGMKTKHLDRIFERFYCIDKARSRAMGGTGLGLSIVKHLISSMQGRIAVTSEVGRGSEFTVHLRLADHRVATER